MDTELRFPVNSDFTVAQAAVHRACTELKMNRVLVADSVREQVSMDTTLTPFLGGSTVKVPNVVCASSNVQLAITTATATTSTTSITTVTTSTTVATSVCTPMTTHTGARGYEMGWKIYEGAEEVCAKMPGWFRHHSEYSQTCCLPAGEYTLKCSSGCWRWPNWCKGWFGGYLTIGGTEYCRDFLSGREQVVTVPWGL